MKKIVTMFVACSFMLIGNAMAMDKSHDHATHGGQTSMDATTMEQSKK